MVIDPLEPVRRDLRVIEAYLDLLPHYISQINEKGVSLTDRTLGELGALFSDAEELRQENEKFLLEGMTAAEREMRRQLTGVLSRLMDTLREIRRR